MQQRWLLRTSLATKDPLGHRGLAWLPALPVLPMLPVPNGGWVSGSSLSKAPQGMQQAGAQLQAASIRQGLS